MTAATPGQGAFVRALFEPGLAPPSGLTAGNGADVSRRLNVHRNNVIASLIEVLRETVPVTRMLVGDAFFDAMSSCFIRQRPPSSPLMHRYGEALPDWIETFAPASALPYLADVARLEVMRWQALHAADSQPIDPAAFDECLARPETLASLVLVFHPGLQLLCSRHAVVSLWSAHQQPAAERDAMLAGIDLLAPQAALVLRPQDDVLVVPVAVEDVALVGSLRSGHALGNAVSRHPAADLTRVLAQLLRHGAVIDCQVAPVSLVPQDTDR